MKRPGRQEHGNARHNARGPGNGEQETKAKPAQPVTHLQLEHSEVLQQHGTSAHTAAQRAEARASPAQNKHKQTQAKPPPSWPKREQRFDQKTVTLNCHELRKPGGSKSSP